MKVTGLWLNNPATQQVMSMLAGGGFQAFAVGGCVRNALLKIAVNDVDIATNAHPEQVIALAKNIGLKTVPTGSAIRGPRGVAAPHSLRVRTDMMAP